MTRNKKLVKMMALAVAASTVATSVPAYAAFDATYYAQQNPDVVAAIGTKPADLETHYNVFGKKEGRAGSADEIGSSALRQLFDAEYYAKMNPDVAAVYGNDANALFSHFLQFGIKEGRRINPYFDVNAYKKAYPDLVAAFGDDIAAYYNHFATNGIKEHRTLGGFPAEKIVPGGVAVASSGGSSSSSSGGGGGSSKPAPKPADVTPTPDPTPAPQPEPEPEPAPEPTSQDYIDVAIGIADVNAELAEEIDKYTNNHVQDQPITQAEKASLVARALNTLNDADALKTMTAENLKVAEAELESAQKALITAENNLSTAASTNTALGQFTTSKRIIAKVATELTDYYDAIDDVETAQNAVDATTAKLAEAKSANDAAQKAYDKAFDNVKSTILAVDDTKKASDFEKKEDSAVVQMLLNKAGANITYNADTSEWNTDDANVSLDEATKNLVELKRRYANEKVGNEELITETGRVSDVVYDRVTRKVTTASNVVTLRAAQMAYLNNLLATPSNFVQVGVTEKFILTEDAEKQLKSIGFTEAQITNINDDGTGRVVGAIKIKLIDLYVDEDTPESGAYVAVAKKLTADSNEIKSTRFDYNADKGLNSDDDNAITTTASGAISGKTYAEIADAIAKAEVKDKVDIYVDQYKATVAATDYSIANDKLNDAVNGTKVKLEAAENNKNVADEALKSAEEDLKEAELSVTEAEKERDEAYEAAGVAGNAELAARDAALEDEIREQHEYDNAKDADDAAKAAYNNAMTNYADASKLDTDYTAD